jgi:hypothetical protein
MTSNIISSVWRQLPRCVKPEWFSLPPALAILWSTETAQANVRLEITGTPFYARIAQGEIYTDGVWAAIAFYYDPACVPDTFSLLDFFYDVAPECDSFVAGFAIFGDAGPIQSRLNLNSLTPMTIWFVHLDELLGAISKDDDRDGFDELTKVTIASLPTLKVGYATFYSETLHPYGAAQQTMISIVASGYFDREDGSRGAFTYQATGTKENNRLNHVKIEFK